MERKRIFLLSGLLILVVAIGVTFAYLAAQSNKGDQKDVNVSADRLDNFQFSVDKQISLAADQFNFASGSGNLSDNATATASLRANSSKNTATYNYYVYFNILNNNFVYTTSDSKPEIILTITNPNGIEVTSIDGLNYVSATNADGTIVKGFDITTKTGLQTIASNYEITSNSSTNYTNQTWNFKVTFINLATNQIDNEDKTLNAQIMIQKDQYNTKR